MRTVFTYTATQAGNRQESMGFDFQSGSSYDAQDRSFLRETNPSNLRSGDTRSLLRMLVFTAIFRMDSQWRVQEQTLETNTIAAAINLIDLLEQYGEEREYEQFTNTVQNIDWSQRTADEMLRVLDLHLHLGMNQEAIRLTQQAAPYYPNHDRVQRAARVLAHPKGRVTYTSPPHGLQASRDWVRNHAGSYGGQWVAVYDGTLVGVAGTLRELQEIVAKKHTLESVLITKV